MKQQSRVGKGELGHRNGGGKGRQFWEGRSTNTFVLRRQPVPDTADCPLPWKCLPRVLIEQRVDPDVMLGKGGEVEEGEGKGGYRLLHLGQFMYTSAGVDLVFCGYLGQEVNK